MVTTIEAAAEVPAALLEHPHPLVAAGSAVWHREGSDLTRLAAWRAALPAATTFGPLPFEVADAAALGGSAWASRLTRVPRTPGHSHRSFVGRVATVDDPRAADGLPPPRAVTGHFALTSMPSEVTVREAELRFGHPYAVVAVASQYVVRAGSEYSEPGPWHGVPVFSAWVSEPEDVPDT